MITSESQVLSTAIFKVIHGNTSSPSFRLLKNKRVESYLMRGFMMHGSQIPTANEFFLCKCIPLAQLSLRGKGTTSSLMGVV